MAGLDPTLEVPRGLVEEVRRLVDAGDREAARELIPDELLDRLAFAGTPEQVARRAAALFDGGVSRVEFGTPHRVSPRQGIELLAARVAPEFGV